MRYEFDRPPRRWGWVVVLLAGGVIGALEAFGIVGLAWIAAPDVTEPIVTQHDWWPPDSALLVAVATVAVPVAFVVGTGVSAGVHALARVLDESVGLGAAAFIAGILTAGAGFFAGVPIAAIVEAPPLTLPFVAVAAGLAGLVLSVLALGLRAPGPARR